MVYEVHTISFLRGHDLFMIKASTSILYFPMLMYFLVLCMNRLGLCLGSVHYQRRVLASWSMYGSFPTYTVSFTLHVLFMSMSFNLF